MSVPEKRSLLHHDIGSTLYRMTVPMLVGMFTLMSFNLVDTFFISLLGTKELAAVSFTFPVTFTFISLAIGLGIGTSAVIAKALGSGNPQEARSDALAALWLAVYLMVILTFVGWLVHDSLFRLLGASETILPLIRQYMLIWLAGAVFLMIPMIGNSVLRAAGDTRLPAYIMAAGGVINALLDPLLIFGLGPFPALGMQGAALASVISWICGSLVVLLVLHQRRLIDQSWQVWQTALPIYRKILRIGFPAAGANMLTPLAMAVLTAIIASYGAEAVAAFGVGIRLESMACLVVLALSTTLPPFISQNFGAGYLPRVQAAFQQSIRFIFLWQLVVYALLSLLAVWIARIFSSDAEVQRLIQLFLWILPLGYGLQGVIILTNSSLNALHLPLQALGLSICRLFVFYVPFAWLGGQLASIQGLFIGCVLANLCMALLSYYWFQRALRQVELSATQAGAAS
ncbi:MATE family efflux transporter [Alkalimonas sp. MEB108]|uniref:MATE family efflux transporter n=1 Tax=Alkalimonas cellulosilytica TaxID=3058395 RepID=A0ABU7J4G3_9GAMM|nr:MATE family efflux transporter [Alkalimonas sp. MEB108]MEE2001233.1 MATE family efflux transporter [Alkalimonas sp. MEB108]